jgi:hypothetical protein
VQANSYCNIGPKENAMKYRFRLCLAISAIAFAVMYFAPAAGAQQQEQQRATHHLLKSNHRRRRLKPRQLVNRDTSNKIRMTATRSQLFLKRSPALRFRGAR